MWQRVFLLYSIERRNHSFTLKMELFLFSSLTKKTWTWECVTLTKTYAYFNMWCEVALKCKCTNRVLVALPYCSRTVWRPTGMTENETIANRHICVCFFVRQIFIWRKKVPTEHITRRYYTYLRACLAPYALAKPKISYFTRHSHRCNCFFAFIFFCSHHLRSAAEKVQNALGYRFTIIFNFTAPASK